ncbi:hypothetical protein BRAO375_860044 [Bradyrhizobium sp. ORS 375]|nr:hypothetical protein BRAO375_860044 [Bradyrhizobium sp. ORS 375]
MCLSMSEPSTRVADCFNKRRRYASAGLQQYLDTLLSFSVSDRDCTRMSRANAAAPDRYA